MSSQAAGLGVVLTLVLVACGPKAPPQSAEPEPTATAEPTTPEPTSRDVAALLDEATELLAATPPTPAKNQKARDLLEDALEADPNDAMVRFNLGVAYHRLGDFGAAERQYQAATGIDPALGEAYLYLGYLHEQRGQINAALSAYRSGIAADSEFMPLHVALAQGLRAAGKPQEAITAAKAALKVNANSIDVYNALGQAYMDTGDYTLAKFVFQKAIQSTDDGDNDAAINTNLGWTYFKQDQRPYAVLRLKKALEIDPELVPALVYLSHIHMDDHNYAAALELLEKAAAQDPDNPDLQLNLGISYRGVGKLEEAKKAYERVLALDPERDEALFNLGILYGDHLKDYDASVKAFEQYLAAGGPEAARTEEYIKLVERERKNAERRRKAEADRKEREKERIERQKLAEQAKKDEAKAPPEDAADPPDDGGGEESPEGEEASPWGEQEGAEPGAEAEGDAGGELP